MEECPSLHIRLPLTWCWLGATVPTCARFHRQAERRRKGDRPRLVGDPLVKSELSVPWQDELGHRRHGPDCSICSRCLDSRRPSLPAYCCHMPTMRLHRLRECDRGRRSFPPSDVGYASRRDLGESACRASCASAPVSVILRATGAETDGSTTGVPFPCISEGMAATAHYGGRIG